ncbi:hypothetical protein P5673_022706 [Acropora cervicornis]|uniref:Uncharacterized protein n=1 Tax=Acropora cervicornis TaxID=6130 RepID=A0AAD9UZG0_ACRCE|nr:hypothetical protein P5673_022706 [Acropora cervicornis]
MRCEFFAAFPNHLQPWVSRVQETVLASKAEGTIRTYLADFKRWKLWALFNVPDFEANSPSPALNAVYCIDWVQRLTGLPRVSDPILSSMNRPRQTNFVTGRIDLDEYLPLFRALSSSRSTSKVGRQGLSYSRAREIVKDAFKDISNISCISLQFQGWRSHHCRLCGH